MIASAKSELGNTTMPVSTISIVICTYNRAESLRKTLNSCQQLEIPPGVSCEIVVVDNNSADQTKQVVLDFSAGPTIRTRYFFESRQGKSFALNRAIEEAAGEVLAFTDDDVTLDPGWLSNLKLVFDRHSCAAVGGRVIPVWIEAQPQWLELEGPYALKGPIVAFDLGETIKQMEIPPFGANMAFRREALRKYGFFRTDLSPEPLHRVLANFLHHDGKLQLGEDSEFGVRLLEAGESVIYAPAAKVFHPVEPHRASKSYFLTWHFLAGRYGARGIGWPAGTVCYFGVPRFLIRKLAQFGFKWIMASDPKRRLYQKAQVYKVTGAILESYRLTRARSCRPMSQKPTGVHAA